jgi:hypothetical protein
MRQFHFYNTLYTTMPFYSYLCLFLIVDIYDFSLERTLDFHMVICGQMKYIIYAIVSELLSAKYFSNNVV